MKMLTPNQVLFENVTAQYPRINQTYRFDNMENKTVPCRPEEDGAAYEISFNMTNEDATEFLKKCDEIYAETAAADTKRKWKPKPMYYPYKELDDGTPQGKAKLKGAYGAFSAAAEFKSKLEQLDSNVTVDVRGYKEGGRGPLPKIKTERTWSS